MRRRHAPATDDPEHEEEHALMMLYVRGVDARFILHDHDPRENYLPGRRRREGARNRVADHLLGPHHNLELPDGAVMDDLLDLHDEAHRAAS